MVERTDTPFVAGSWMYNDSLDSYFRQDAAKALALLDEDHLPVLGDVVLDGGHRAGVVDDHDGHAGQQQRLDEDAHALFGLRGDLVHIVHQGTSLMIWPSCQSALAMYLPSTSPTPEAIMGNGAVASTSRSQTMISGHTAGR